MNIDEKLSDLKTLLSQENNSDDATKEFLKAIQHEAALEWKERCEWFAYNCGCGYEMSTLFNENDPESYKDFYEKMYPVIMSKFI